MARTLNTMSLAAIQTDEALLVQFTDIMEAYMTCETQKEKIGQS